MAKDILENVQTTNIIAETIKLITGAGTNKILTSDAVGLASWQTPTTSEGKRVYSKIVKIGSDDGTADYYCDGVDDQIQIQQAINDIAGLGGYGTVFLRAGKYYINGNITIGNGIKGLEIIGEAGAEFYAVSVSVATYLKTSGTMTPKFDFISLKGIFFNQITVEILGDNGTDAVVNIDDCEFFNNLGLATDVIKIQNTVNTCYVYLTDTTLNTTNQVQLWSGDGVNQTYTFINNCYMSKFAMASHPTKFLINNCIINELHILTDSTLIKGIITNNIILTSLTVDYDVSIFFHGNKWASATFGGTSTKRKFRDNFNTTSQTFYTDSFSKYERTIDLRNSSGNYTNNDTDWTERGSVDGHLNLSDVFLNENKLKAYVMFAFRLKTSNALYTAYARPHIVINGNTYYGTEVSTNEITIQNYYQKIEISLSDIVSSNVHNCIQAKVESGGNYTVYHERVFLSVIIEGE